MAHLSRCSHCTPRKLNGWDQGGDKTHLGRVCSPSTWLPELLGPGKGTETKAQPSLCLCGVPKNLNLSSLVLGNARNPGPALDSSPAEQPGT